jgi:hypothetical protein
VPSVLTPQTKGPELALTDAKVPAGGVIQPFKLSPQQTTVPSVLTAQAKWLPALTETKVPAGGVIWPEDLLPQHATPPLFFNPQANMLPVLTDTNAGAVSVGETAPSLGTVGSPSGLRPHPALLMISSITKRVRIGRVGPEGSITVMTIGAHGATVKVETISGSGGG